MVNSTAATRKAGRPAVDSTDIPDDDEILSRGLAAFAELGYDRASVRELARRIGVSHNFVNDRYGSKEAFWKAAVDSAQSVVVAELQQILERDYDDEVDRLRDGIRTFHRMMAARPDLARIMQDEASRDTERLRYIYDRHVLPVVRVLEPGLRRHVAEGRVRDFPVDVILFSAIAMTQVVDRAPVLRLLGDTIDTDPSGFLPMLSEIVLDGIIAPA